MPNKPSNQETIFQPTDRSTEEWENSTAAQSLKRLQANPRVLYIVVAAPEDACPACQNLTGTYAKDEVPQLPVDCCSHPLGCRAYYLPYLNDIYP